MNTTKKITKKEQYSVLLDIIDAVKDSYTLNDGITFDDLTSFIYHEIELLDNKTAAAQKRAAAKKEEGDALREEIYNVLTDELMTIDEIVAAIGNGVKRNMVVSRLTQLHQLGRVEKDSIPANEDGVKARKISAYKRA